MEGLTAAMVEVLLILEVRCLVCDVRLEEAICNLWAPLS
jgi:hypothetical protein